MKWRKYLRLAQHTSRIRATPKPHIVVCAAFEGNTLVAIRENTEAEHAEIRVLAVAPNADRLVVWRFNRADPARTPRTSCPCVKCCARIRDSKARRVECYVGVGPAIVKVAELEPYNG